MNLDRAVLQEVLDELEHVAAEAEMLHLVE